MGRAASPTRLRSKPKPNAKQEKKSRDGSRATRGARPAALGTNEGRASDRIAAGGCRPLLPTPAGAPPPRRSQPLVNLPTHHTPHQPQIRYKIFPDLLYFLIPANLFLVLAAAVVAYPATCCPILALLQKRKIYFFPPEGSRGGGGANQAFRPLSTAKTSTSYARVPPSSSHRRIREPLRIGLGLVSDSGWAFLSVNFFRFFFFGSVCCFSRVYFACGG